MRLPPALFVSLRILSSLCFHSLIPLFLGSPCRSFQFAAASNRYSLWRNARRDLSTSDRMTSSNDNDAAAYNVYVSATVDLSNAHLSASGILTRASHHIRSSLCRAHYNGIVTVPHTSHVTEFMLLFFLQ